MKKFLCELNGISLERLSLNETANAAPLFVSSQRNFHHPMASDHNDPSQLLYATGRSVDPRSWHGGMHREAFAAFHAPGLRAAPPPAPMGRPGAAGRAAGRDQLGPSSVQLPPDALSLSGILDLPSIMTTPQKAPKHAGDADQLPSIQLGFTDTTFDQRTMISFTGIEDLMSPQQDAQKPTAPALQKGPVDFREFYAKQRALQPDRPNSESMRIGGSYCMPGKTSSASVDTLQRSSAATNNLFRPQTAAAAATATATAGVGAGSSSSSTGGPMSNASPPQPSTAELLHSVLGGESLMSLGNVLDLSAPGLEPSGLNARGHQQEQAALSVAPDRAPDGVADGRETRGAAGTAMSDMASGLSLIDCPSVFKSNLGGESKLDGASSGHSTDRVPVASGGSAVNKRPFQDMQSRARIAAGKEQEPQASGKCAPDDGSNSRNSADSSSSSSSLEFRADLFDGTSRLHVSDMTRGGSCSVAPINDAEHDCRGSLLPDCSSNFNGELTNVVRLLVPQSAENAAASKQSSKSDSRNSEDVTGEAAATPARPFEHITSQGPLILRSVDGDNTMSRKSLSNYSDDSNAALRSPKRKRAPDDEISSRKDRSNNHSRSNDSSNKKPKGGFFAMVMAKSNG